MGAEYSFGVLLRTGRLSSVLGVALTLAAGSTGVRRDGSRFSKSGRSLKEAALCSAVFSGGVFVS